MKRFTHLHWSLGVGLILTSPVQAQFVGFNPDSFGEFFTVSTPQNSTNGVNASGVAVSGNMLWDSSNLVLRVIINNLAGTEIGNTGDFYEIGTLVGFGFEAPAFATVDLGDRYGIYNGDVTSDKGNLEFQALAPYDLTGETSFNRGVAMPVGAGTGSSANNGTTSQGILPGTSAYFDFLFTGIDPADFNFTGFGYSQVPEHDDEFTIAFRYKGIGPREDSDKFGGYVVPEPSFYGFAGIAGLAVLIVIRRVRKTPNS